MRAQKEINELAIKEAKQLYKKVSVRAKHLEKKAQEWTREGYAQANVRAAGFYAQAQKCYAGEDGELEKLEAENHRRMVELAVKIGQQPAASNISLTGMQGTLAQQRRDFEGRYGEVLKEAYAIENEQAKMQEELVTLTKALQEEANERTSADEKELQERIDIQKQIVNWGPSLQKQEKSLSEYVKKSMGNMHQKGNRTTETLEKQQVSLHGEIARIKKEQEDISKNQQALKGSFIPRSEIERIAEEKITEKQNRV